MQTTGAEELSARQSSKQDWPRSPEARGIIDVPSRLLSPVPADVQPVIYIRNLLTSERSESYIADTQTPKNHGQGALGNQGRGRIFTVTRASELCVYRDHTPWVLSDLQHLYVKKLRVLNIDVTWILEERYIDRPR